VSIIREWTKTTATHEVTVDRIVGLTDAYYLLGIDCLDADGIHVRASSISRHEERGTAIRHATRLTEIMEWDPGRTQ